MRDDPHSAGLDALIDETARALTAAAPPASLRGTVRRRMGSLKVEPRVPVWQPVLGALLVGLIAVTLWPARTSDLAPAEGTSRTDIVSPREPSPLDDGARPVSGSATAMRPQRLDPPGGVSGSRSAAPHLQDAPPGEPAPESAIPLLTVAAVGVDALRIEAVDVERIAEPVPLHVEWLEIAPVALE